MCDVMMSFDAGEPRAEGLRLVHRQGVPLSWGNTAHRLTDQSYIVIIFRQNTLTTSPTTETSGWPIDQSIRDTLSTRFDVVRHRLRARVVNPTTRVGAPMG